MAPLPPFGPSFCYLPLPLCWATLTFRFLKQGKVFSFLRLCTSVSFPLSALYLPAHSWHFKYPFKYPFHYHLVGENFPDPSSLSQLSNCSCSFSRPFFLFGYLSCVSPLTSAARGQRLGCVVHSAAPRHGTRPGIEMALSKYLLNK